MPFNSLPKKAEFFDLEMDSAFSDLKTAVDAYLKSSFGYVYHNTNGTAGVPPEWCREDGRPPDERFWPAVKELNEKATSVWNAYCQFIKFGRLRLNIEMHAVPTES